MYARNQYNFDIQEPRSIEPMDEFYGDEMQEYIKYAIRRFDLYLTKSDVVAFANCVAFSFCENLTYAVEIFKTLNLRAIHAYAILENIDWFRDEMDSILQSRSGDKYE